MSEYFEENIISEDDRAENQEQIVVHDEYAGTDETDNTQVKPKKNRRTYGRGIALGCGTSVLALILIIAVGFIIATNFIPSLRPEQTKTVTNVPQNNGLDISKISQKLETIQKVIEDRFLFEEDPEKVETAIYDGLMAGLDDPYSVYYDKDDLKKMEEDTTGTYSGIGAMIQQDVKAGTLTIIRVFDGSPAQEAGVEVGDIIYKVDDTMANEVDFDVLVSHHIKGPEGTVVTITFIRDGETVDIPITRRKVDAPSVESKIVEGNIGYIEVTEFSGNTYSQFVNAVDKLTDDGAKGLIIDLRDNPGGLLDAAIEMADYMLPEGLITYTADKNGKGEKYYSNDRHQVELPIIILANGNSASAAEVFTGAMLDYDAAKLVGTQTFGKGIVQNIIPFSDGTGIKLTVQHYYTPNGFDLHGEGLTPDVKIELNEECKAYCDDNDNQYRKALELLK